MAKMIQIRHVPEELHRTLKVRAAATGLSLSDYLLQELRQIADKPTLAELFGRIEAGEPAGLDAEAIVAEIREGREEREQRISRASTRRA